MNHKQIILGIAATLALTACGGAKAASSPLSAVTPNPPAAADSSSAPVATSAAATSAAKPSAAKKTSEGLATGATPSTNARGNLVKKVGQLAGLSFPNSEDKMEMTFKVTSITPNFKCDAQFAQTPKNGHTVAIGIDETLAPKAVMGEGGGPLDAGWFSWNAKIIKRDGTTENGTQLMSGCAKDSESLPMQVGPGEHAKGLLVVDTSQTKGAVVLSLIFMQNGWEYSF